MNIWRRLRKPAVVPMDGDLAESLEALWKELWDRRVIDWQQGDLLAKATKQLRGLHGPVGHIVLAGSPKRIKGTGWGSPFFDLPEATYEVYVKRAK